jgi:hypothetical protein
MLTDPLRIPAADGLKDMLIKQAFLAASAVGQSLI